ncbi:MAG TPA: PEGA domain-containing protein, partial [Bacteroidia bacterium]|nr:PEGA domain-containing protein [Bacteroidia bacterium]
MIIVIRNFIFLAAILLLLSGCSKTIISSSPDNARVYIKGKYKGETPYAYKDCKFIFSKTKITLKKDGYDPIDTAIIRKEKPAFGAIGIQSYFILTGFYNPLPLLWVMGYAPHHKYTMIPNDEFKLTDTVSIGKPKTLYYDYSKPSLRFAINPTEPLMNDYSFFIDYVAKKKRSFGISVGYMIANKWWNKDNRSSPEVNDNNFPVGVYNGFVGRVYYKWYFINDKVRYISSLFIFKDIHYDNASFVDQIRPFEWIVYERSEKTKVFGLELLYGRENYLTKHIFLEFYGGIGARIRKRNYNTTKIWPSNAESVIPLGEFTRNQFFPTIHLGVKVGFAFLFGKIN